VLRFISAYIIIAFTIQRLLIVYHPLKIKFKSKSFAWKIILIILIVSFLINLWIPLLFDLHTAGDNNKFCEIRKIYMDIYLFIASIYVVLILIIPLMIIFTSNILIIIATRKSSILKRKMSSQKKLVSFNADQTKEFKSKKFQVRRRNALTINRFNFHFKPLYLSKEQIKRKEKKFNSKRVTTLLLLISFSYVLLNCPYTIAWYLFFIEFSPLVRIF